MTELNLFEGIEYLQSLTIGSLPAKREQINSVLKIAGLLKNEPQYAVELVLAGHDDPAAFLFAWQGEGYKMVLRFPMEDFGWCHPLLLSGNKLALEDVEKILNAICLECKGTQDIDALNPFRNITRLLYKDTLHEAGRTELNRSKEGLSDFHLEILDM